MEKGENQTQRQGGESWAGLSLHRAPGSHPIMLENSHPVLCFPETLQMPKYKCPKWDIFEVNPSRLSQIPGKSLNCSYSFPHRALVLPRSWESCRQLGTEVEEEEG